MQTNYGDYETIMRAHEVALSLNWIVRVGFDQARNKYWIEYVGKAAPAS